jgi:hypothetical protein
LLTHSKVVLRRPKRIAPAITKHGASLLVLSGGCPPAATAGRRRVRARRRALHSPCWRWLHRSGRRACAQTLRATRRSRRKAPPAAKPTSRGVRAHARLPVSRACGGPCAARSVRARKQRHRARASHSLITRVVACARLVAQHRASVRHAAGGVQGGRLPRRGRQILQGASQGRTPPL